MGLINGNTYSIAVPVQWLERFVVRHRNAIEDRWLQYLPRGGRTGILSDEVDLRGVVKGPILVGADGEPCTRVATIMHLVIDQPRMPSH